MGIQLDNGEMQMFKNLTNAILKRKHEQKQKSIPDEALELLKKIKLALDDIPMTGEPKLWSAYCMLAVYLEQFE